jgi:CSLREA domain-containing protein
MKRRTLLAVCILVAGCMTLFSKSFGSSVEDKSPRALASAEKRIMVQAGGRGNPHLNFEDVVELPSVYEGAPDMQSFLKQNAAEPRALASADFDEDGVPDLICGYARGVRGLVTLHRGNVDSIHQNSPEAQRRKAEGTFSDSAFLSPALVFEAPIAADFVGAGDFDGDGHWDLVIAARGGKELCHLPGDGKGSFLSAQKIGLSGAVTSLIAGEINRADGLIDVIVGVVTDGGAKALAFEGPEGALKVRPEIFSLPGEPRALALGQFDGDYLTDLAVGAGSELVMIHGRDRKLSLDGSRKAEVHAAVVEQRSFDFDITSIAAGDFDGTNKTGLALLARDGMVYLTGNRTGEAKKETKSKQDKWAGAYLIGQWRGATRLVRARVSTGSADDLLLLNEDTRELHVLNTGLNRVSPSSVVSLAGVAASLSMEGEALAVLPMRLNADALSDLVILHRGQSGPAVVKSVAASTFTVNTADDHNDGACDSKDCTLREAINAANANPGADTIAFDIPGAGIHTIIPTIAEMPPVTDSTTIDGTTQPGFAGTPVIELKGSDKPGGFGSTGISLIAPNNTVRGLVINRFGKSFGVGSAGNRIEGNFVGTDVTGTLVSGNELFGLAIDGNGNTIGGTTSEARNLISGNGRIGLWISSGIGNQVQGNFIGTDVSGTIALGNDSSGMTGAGVEINSSDNLVGGAVPGARNLISGNDLGVFLLSGFGQLVQANRVQGNFIGTDIGGNVGLGNSQVGVELFTNPAFSMAPGNNLVGGTIVGARNVISANEIGIVLVRCDDNLVQGNFIGTGIDGVTPLGNTLFGIQNFDSSDNSIGGVAAGAGNTIAYSGADGVNIVGSPSMRNAVSSNAIFSNGLLGINLGDSGVTPNDLCDADAGANNRQNFPLLTSAATSGVSSAIQGTLNSGPNSTFRIEFFANVDCDPSGFGEGREFIGSTSVATTASCSASFSVILPAVPVGRFITATATDPAGNTSEFSQCVQVQQGPVFDLCIQDESNGNILVVNSTTGDYQFTNCQGALLSGAGSLTRRGCLVTLQVNGPDRRILARIDTCSRTGNASIQLLSQGSSFSILDRNTSNNTCTCDGPD